ncbi:thiamine kinase [Intestinirhabdus alba]|uniref:Thiamine kinase n=1 Tax=Intestinirhabdus alba TaxID=2899544 RepID=A0A6L6ILD0_9ENTR|nr:thiamine kinase [Intestinirhabdus alba]
MRSSSNKSLTRDEVLSRYFPHYHPVGSAETGLSGGGIILESGARRVVLRQHHDPCAPASRLLRHYRALSRLPESLAPAPCFYAGGWMAVAWLPGEVKADMPEADALAGLLYHLHRQPRFGWRITLLPLLEQYWQGGDPARRTPFWLRQLKRLRRAGEPNPLRLAPLHMDVHPGNLVHTPAGLRLIDWEYAGDGDIALELASTWGDEAQLQRLVEAYARRARLRPALLWRQVRRWRPWVAMLQAGWFEYRWRQTGEQQFIRLANETWRQLLAEG